MAPELDAAGRRCVRGLQAAAARLGLGDVDARGCWRRANHEVAARVALAAAREGLVEATWHDDALELPGWGTLALARTHALGLHAPASTQPETWLDDATATWHALAARMPIDARARERIAAELDDGRSRMALALLAADTRAQWSRRRRDDDPRNFDAEHFVIRGHPWHPMTKTRLGLGWADNLRLAPELCARARVLAVDLPRAWVRERGDFAAHSAPWLGTAPAGHVRVPVLAAQWRRLPAAVRALGPAPVAIVGRSLASLRTVALDGHDCHLKLALDVLTTSARRTVSPMSVANATAVSALIAAAQRRDASAAGAPALVVLPERAAVGLAPEFAGEAARQLGVIVRDTTVLQAGDTIVCAALDELDAAGRPFVARLLDGYPGEPAVRARAMFGDYVEQLVPPALRLWSAHGIALEAHLQNALVRVRGGKPVGFVVRDLGGIRLHRGRLAAAGHAIVLDPASFIATDDEAEAADKLVHALIHAHLAAVIRTLVAHAALDEAWAWQRVAAVIAGCLQRWSAEPAVARACAYDRARLFAPRVRGKALLRMRIADQSSAYSYVELDNPLAAAAPIAAHGGGAPGSCAQ